MINYPVIVNTVKNHKKHKPILLNYIEELKQNSNTRYENIDTDWALSKETKRNYLDYFYNDVIEPTILEVGNQLGFNNIVKKKHTIGTIIQMVNLQTVIF